MENNTLTQMYSYMQFNLESHKHFISGCKSSSSSFILHLLNGKWMRQCRLQVRYSTHKCLEFKFQIVFKLTHYAEVSFVLDPALTWEKRYEHVKCEFEEEECMPVLLVLQMHSEQCKAFTFQQNLTHHSSSSCTTFTLFLFNNGRAVVEWAGNNSKECENCK